MARLNTAMLLVVFTEQEARLYFTLSLHMSVQVPAISNEDLKAVGANYLPVVVENATLEGDGRNVSILWQVHAALRLVCRRVCCGNAEI